MKVIISEPYVFPLRERKISNRFDKLKKYDAEIWSNTDSTNSLDGDSYIQLGITITYTYVNSYTNTNNQYNIKLIRVISMLLLI